MLNQPINSRWSALICDLWPHPYGPMRDFLHKSWHKSQWNMPIKSFALEVAPSAVTTLTQSLWQANIACHLVYFIIAWLTRYNLDFPNGSRSQPFPTKQSMWRWLYFRESVCLPSLKDVPIWHFCGYADIADSWYADIADIFIWLDFI